ncbi:MAG: hypothetical protein JKY52_11350 [Flavobacteriales bacterium]|nr:hypothetical protein [Flavobacteriales bacterium]
MSTTYVLKIILPLLFAVSVGELMGQSVLLEEDVNADTVEVVKGPNKRVFSHMYLGVAFAAGPDSAGSRINYGKSFDITIGRRTKWKISSFYALGLDLEYHMSAFNLAQEAGKLLPNDSVHDSERLKFHNLAAGFYNRFSLNTRRGNYIGNFIDLGVRLDVPILSTHVTEDELDRAGYNNGRDIKTKTTDLRFITDFNYSGYFRLGFNKYVLTASYRLSDLFISDSNLYAKYGNGLTKYPELPALSVGVQLGLH